MIIPLTSFIVSLVLIISMIVLKYFEIKNNGTYFLSKLSKKTDSFFIGITLNIKKAVSYLNRHTFIALVQFVAYHILSRARKVYIWAYNKAHEHPHSKKVIDMVRGKGDIGKVGGASFYLKRISDNVYSEGSNPSFAKK